MILHIKNLVCERCVMIIRPQPEQLGFTIKHIELGQAEIKPDPNEAQLQEIGAALKIPGFELINKDADKIVESIKNIIIAFVHHTEISECKTSYSDLIASKLGKDYDYLSRTFSNSQETTIERFFIEQKVEKIKELMEYGEMNLSEISHKMGYSSSAHLSTQFKSVTGLTPSRFKISAKAGCRPIDHI